MITRRLLATIVLLAVPLAPPAQAAPDRRGSLDGGNAEAAERFDRGLERFEAGDLPTALAEFERAYALVAHPAVLLNLALVHAKLDHPVEALAALDRLIATPEAGARLGAERLAVAHRVRAEQARRVGLLKLTSNVPAVIEVDGIEVARTPGTAPVRVKAGVRLVAATSPGHIPSRKAVTVASGSEVTVEFALVPAEAPLAELALETGLPEVEILVDGQFVARTPLLKSLALPAGQRRIDLRRDGYQAQTRQLDLAPGAKVSLPFTLSPAPDAAASHGQLVLAGRALDVDVAVDGQPPAPYRGPLRLPPGTHHVHISRAGFLPRTEVVAVRPGTAATIPIDLRPTAETRARLVDEVGGRKRWAWLSLGAGTALAAGAGVFTFFNQRSLADARTERDDLVRSFMPGGACDSRRGADIDECNARTSAAADRVDTHRHRRVGGFVAGGVGAAAIILGGVLLMTAPDLADVGVAAYAPGGTPPGLDFMVGPTAVLARVGGRF